MTISSLPYAVMKMIGVISDCSRCRMSAAVSNPSMTGMRTSSRMTAKSWAMTQRKRGESGVGFDDAIAERRQHGLQRQPLRGVVVDHQDRDGRRAVVTAVHRRRVAEPRALMPAAHGRQPRLERGEELGGVDRLGDVVVGAGVDAALALAGHDLAGDGDDRERLELIDRADGADRRRSRP